jgi:hypothetical protein
MYLWLQLSELTGIINFVNKKKLLSSNFLIGKTRGLYGALVSHLAKVITVLTCVRDVFSSILGVDADYSGKFSANGFRHSILN